MMKILSVVGARPNFMKVAPIISEIKKYNQNKNSRPIEHILVHTGQHYDESMSDSFFKDLSLPKPDFYLGVRSGSHAAQTAEIMKSFEGIILEEKPDVVIVVGDVNSTVASALVASKVSYDSNGTRPLVAHIEAGLRSFDRTMPEEINRILTDHMSDFLFVTEESGIKNLKREGISSKKIHFVGNTMIDTLLAFRDIAKKSPILERLGLLPKKATKSICFHTESQHLTLNTRRSIIPYALLTLHRPSNVDHRENFINIIEALKTISKHLPIIFPCHPRTKSTIYSFGLENHFIFLGSKTGHGEKSSGKVIRTIKPINSINLIDPLGYVDFLGLMSNATLVFTDSGGIQEETTCLGVPCITIRKNTERPITLTQGTNFLAGVQKDKIIKAFYRQTKEKRKVHTPKYWDGKAAERIIKTLANKMNGGE